MYSPDVSAQGVRYYVVVGNETGLESGTSAAAPAFAGIISLLNDYRFRHGIASANPHPYGYGSGGHGGKRGNGGLGWLNPWLYSEGWKGLTDIVEGSNPGCGTGGFNATKGEFLSCFLCFRVWVMKRKRMGDSH